MNEVQFPDYKGFIFAPGACVKLHEVLDTESEPLSEIPSIPVVQLTLNMLLSFGIRTFMLAASPDHLVEYQQVLGDGKQFGAKISYSLTDEGVNAIQALVEVNEFVARSRLVVAKAGVFMTGEGFDEVFKSALATNKRATSFRFKCAEVGVDSVIPELIILDKHSNQYAESAVAEYGIKATLRELQQSIENDGHLNVLECDDDCSSFDFGKPMKRKFSQIKHLLKLAS